ncbi:HAMP domain-containing sensor histidine kinase [Planococcus sp. YIM B11945]|uniref:HAMP domain-containing sensor histidine kinase n=1 Tax=Planococcus sp. YIM B11945 TaxID=3435410 RepID=UPI003D7EB5FB
MKLRNKIHLWSTLLMLVILIVLMIIIYFTFSRLSFSTEIRQLETETEALVTTFNTNPIEDPQTVLRAYVPPSGLIKVMDGENEVIPVIQDATLEEEFPLEVTGRSGTVESEEERFAFVKAPIIWTNGEVVDIIVAQSMREVMDNLRILQLVLVVVTLLAMIPIFFSNALLGKIVTKPITELTGTMTRIRKSGSFEKLPIEHAADDEAGQMGKTFNEMMDLLEENYRKQEEFVSNASHELKTPLTVIGSYAKLLQRRGLNDQHVAKEGIDAIQTETDRMKKLIEQLLHIARRSESTLEIAEADAVEIVKQITTVMETSYNREIEFVSSEPSVYIQTDIAKLKQLLYILLDNAVKYSSAPIRVAIQSEGELMIQVQDHGIGIPKQSLPHIFDRFYRVDEARNRDTGGSGLGLSLAKQLADSLGVKLEVESVEQAGTTVTLIFSSDFNVAAVQSNQEG